jgi:hypothetical protein
MSELSRLTMSAYSFLWLRIDGVPYYYMGSDPVYVGNVFPID